MPIAEAVSTAFGALSAGIHIREAIAKDSVGVSIRVSQFAIGATIYGVGAALAFMSVTNESDSARSVTDVAIDFGTSRASRVPLLNLSYPMYADSIIDAESYVHSSGFEDVSPPFADLRRLPQDIYLRPNESQSGCALFVFEQKGELSPPLVIVEVGGFGILSKQLASLP